MNACGFPRCVFGRAPNTETVENEFPLLVPLSNHWIGSRGHGKYRGGVRTVKQEYKVSRNPTTRRVDLPATAASRTEELAARKERGVPYAEPVKH